MAATPNLPPQFLAPKNLAWGEFMSDGARLRTAFVPAATTVRGECIVVGGFSECAEKYFETLRDLAAQGLDVWFLDWRGQGGSDRPAFHPCRAAPRDYDQDATDLMSFAASVLSTQMPHILVAHSMGAAIALLASSSRPALVDAAVLSAPMLGVATGLLPTRLAVWLARVAVKVGAADKYAPGHGPWIPDAEVAIHNPATRDAIRATVQQEWFLANPALRLDGPTFGWVHAAMMLTERLADADLLRRVTTPLLLGAAGQDVFVDSEAIRRAANLLPRCELREYPMSLHELFMERDDIRSAWMASIFAFLEPFLIIPRAQRAS
jgi:lysophospholipase